MYPATPALPIYPEVPLVPADPVYPFPTPPITDIVPSLVILMPLPILTPPNVLVVAVDNTYCATASTQVF